MFRHAVILTVAASCAFATPALAASPDDEADSEMIDTGEVIDGRAVQVRKRTVIEWDRALDVEGELVKPQMKLLSETKRLQFNPLIELRADFTPEMKASIAEVR